MPIPPRLHTNRLLLTVPTTEVAPRLVAYFDENRAHLEHWDPPRSADFYTASWWEKRLAKNLGELEEGTSLRLSIFRRGEEDEAVIGQCNFTQIFRGPFQACYVGFSIDRRLEGQGVMTEALQGAIAYVFGKLRLHRVMANHLPENERSARVLRRLGFVVEGYAREYLFIDGAWRDHVLTALTNPARGPLEVDEV